MDTMHINDFDYRGECPHCHCPILAQNMTGASFRMMMMNASSFRTCDCGPAELEKITFMQLQRFMVHMLCWACNSVVKRKMTGADLGPLVDPGTVCHT